MTAAEQMEAALNRVRDESFQTDAIAGRWGQGPVVVISADAYFATCDALDLLASGVDSASPTEEVA